MRLVFIKSRQFSNSGTGIIRLVAGLSLQNPGFAPGSIHVGILVNEVELGQVFLRVLRS